MLSVSAPMVTFLRETHPKNIFSPTLVLFTVASSRAAQFSKTDFPIVVTVDGTVIDLSPVLSPVFSKY